MTIPSKKMSATLCVAALVAAVFSSNAVALVSQSGEQKNMRRVGHDDLQGRPAYQPNTIVYPDGRTIAFIGTHGGSKPNPLKGGAVEFNGTMIVDVTHPNQPIEKFHIPVPESGGQAQMARTLSRLAASRRNPGACLPDAQRAGHLFVGLRGVGCHRRHQPRPRRRTARSDRTPTRTTGNARPALPTCPAASPPRLGASSSRW